MLFTKIKKEGCLATSLQRREQWTTGGSISLSWSVLNPSTKGRENSIIKIYLALHRENYQKCPQKKRQFAAWY